MLASNAACHLECQGNTLAQCRHTAGLPHSTAWGIQILHSCDVCFQHDWTMATAQVMLGPGRARGSFEISPDKEKYLAVIEHKQQFNCLLCLLNDKFNQSSRSFLLLFSFFPFLLAEPSLAGNPGSSTDTCAVKNLSQFRLDWSNRWCCNKVVVDQEQYPVSDSFPLLAETLQPAHPVLVLAACHLLPNI